ncbi:pyruvate kinase [Rhodopirellula sp. MGV]|uniref:pyruvate kinase n=1 Tax=Rhodopirellula sp. MGV TaxID=2023130 RepID=UPI000B9782A6|nr:pyruvate kinase [Rhodopirellula sp. MGV]OYP31018.1 pyruvate kinase [Rhodopirellula sp. MGV]PNY34634.1 pyruvate kinase [Rhodopirellula baltica]
MARPAIHQSCTKIVATVGPACDTPERLAELIRAGVDVFRINTAHGKIPDHEQKLHAIRKASEMVGSPAGVLLDLAGPKIRLGELLSEPLQLDVGAELTFIREGEPENEFEVTANYPKLIAELEPGNTVMLADGMVALVVESVTENRAVCRVTAAGEVRSRQGINLPGVKLSVSSLQRNDISNAMWAAENGIDFISLSFVRSAEDVYSLKNLLQAHESEAFVIAKIEKPEALEQLEEIVDAADGIMVARGDLGVEIDVAETPMAQKRIIQVCKEKVKPVIVATQMLESMHHNSTPTRAEASDVANAILDGADACMLSGETAVGDHPVKAVEVMSRIMRVTESNLVHEINHSVSHCVHPITTAVTNAAISIAEAIDAAMIIIATRSGGTAWVKSKSRSSIPTLGVSDCPATLRRIQLFWGIRPVGIEKMASPADIRAQICKWGKEHGQLKKGDRIVFVTGSGVVEKAHNSVVVHSVE